MSTFTISIFSILLLTLSPSWAELNKWVDAQGNVHYGDTVPRGKKTQVIDHSSMSTMDSQSANKGLQELNQVFDAQQKLKQRDQQRQANIEIQRQKQRNYCERLKSDLRAMNTKVRVYTKNEDGTRNYLNDDKREKDITEAHALLKKYCS